MSKESLSVLFLYKTVPGRVILKALVRPGISKTAALLLSSPMSALFVPGFIRRNHIEQKYYEMPAGGYGSFNEFFTRKLKPEYEPQIQSGLVSPCDGLLTVFNIDERSVFDIKNSQYSLQSLLRDSKLSERFSGGTALVFRLTPSHYHRYCYPASGKTYAPRRIGGELHCVRPVALESVKVFTRNSREYTLIRSGEYGNIIQMEVGAMLVGKISNHRRTKGTSFYVECGEEKGYFEYGGSTIILLFEKRFTLCRDIAERERTHGEIPVKMGESLI
ncbi:MAG: phosphatidylserine decarboxylase [Lachnospiraceae bacterium]|nr:phosphatidylserine decarboxylase [Lachnospiraceae bacterium]